MCVCLLLNVRATLFQRYAPSPYVRRNGTAERVGLFGTDGCYHRLVTVLEGNAYLVRPNAFAMQFITLSVASVHLCAEHQQ